MTIEFQKKAQEEMEEREKQMIAMKTNAFLARIPQAQIDADPTWIDKATSAVLSALSKATEPPPPMEKQLARLEVCRSCEQFKPEKKLELVGYCKKCGCGEHRFSALSFKAGIARSTCPLHLWDINPSDFATRDGASPTTPVQTDAETP